MIKTNQGPRPISNGYARSLAQEATRLHRIYEPLDHVGLLGNYPDRDPNPDRVRLQSYDKKHFNIAQWTYHKPGGPLKTLAVNDGDNTLNRFYSFNEQGYLTEVRQSNPSYYPKDETIYHIDFQRGSTVERLVTDVNGHTFSIYSDS